MHASHSGHLWEGNTLVRTPLVCLAALAASLLIAATAQAVLIGPTAYTDFASGPFGSLGGIVLEDFEDGALNTPGVSAGTGFVLAPGSSGLTDSVENAPSGYSYYSGGATTITFTFSGTLPTHAGIVWTDVGYLLGDSPPSYTGVGDVVFEAFDAGGFSLGTIGPVTLGDGNALAMSAEDRFFGAIDAGGISRIVISMPDSDDWEMDHLQFGVVAIPEPATALLLGASLVALACRRR